MKIEKRQIPRLKVLERKGLLRNNNYSIRSGSSLAVESNPIPFAGEKYFQMPECEKQNVRRIMQDLYQTFSSAGSSTFA